MASIFRPFIDAENLSSQVNTTGNLHPAKTFQGNGSRLMTPRKALGNLNVDPRRVLGNISNTVSKLSQGNINKTHLQLKTPSTGLNKNGIHISQNKIKQGKKKSSVTVNSETSQTSAKIQVEPEREKMHIYQDNEKDNFEDIWPKEDRLSTYIDQIIKWKPFQAKTVKENKSKIFVPPEICTLSRPSEDFSQLDLFDDQQIMDVSIPSEELFGIPMTPMEILGWKDWSNS